MWSVKDINGNPIEHLSASSLKVWLECPEKWRQDKILGKEEVPNVYLVWGRAHHAAVAVNMRQKVHSGVDCAWSDVKDEFHRALDEEIVPEMEWRSETESNVRRVGEDLLLAYHTVAAPRIQPISAEEEFLVNFGEFDVAIKGIIDIETEYGVEDVKTSSRAPRSKLPSDYLLQGHIYQLVKRKPVSWTICVKKKPPEIMRPPEHNFLQIPFYSDKQAQKRHALKRMIGQIEWFYNLYGPERPWEGRGVYTDMCWKCSYKQECVWYA